MRLRLTRWARSVLLQAAGAAVLLSLGYLALDYRGPGRIPLETDTVWGLSCLRAHDLVVQGHDSCGDLWATRGMVAYKLQADATTFVRQYRIPTGFRLYWLGNFSLVRRLAARPECVELVPLRDGGAIALSAGYLWCRSGRTGGFVRTLKLRHYGLRTGRGICSQGFATLRDGAIVFGEYFHNSSRGPVCLWASPDGGKTWQVLHTFSGAEIEHVHAVQQDPYADLTWVCTGDCDCESMVARSGDRGATLETIGRGSQAWRVCQLAFTEQAVYWGTDTPHLAASGIYRWARNTHEVRRLLGDVSEIYYATRLAGGTVVMSAACERPVKANGTTSLYVIGDDDSVVRICCGAKARDGRHAVLRFQRQPGAHALCVTCLNQKGLGDGDLVLFPEDVLRNAAVRRVVGVRGTPPQDL